MIDLVNVPDARVLIDLELSLALPQQVLDCAEILLVDFSILFELFACKYNEILTCLFWLLHGCT